MNVKVIRFLLANQSALLKIVEIAKSWRKDLPYLEQWALVDSIARIIIPILEGQAVAPKSLTRSSIYDDLPEDGDYEALVFGAGVEFAALGIDWKMLTEVILPIVISILRALSAGKDE